MQRRTRNRSHCSTEYRCEYPCEYACRCSRAHQANREQRGAFTLIELLVVISIIALLLAILLPVLGSARDAASASICRSNMRQVMVATLMYADENQLYFPQPTNDSDIAFINERARHLWFNAVDRYLGEGAINYGTTAASRKHTQIKNDPIWNSFSESDREVNRTIKMNRFLGNVKNTGNSNGPPNLHFVKVTDVYEPTKTVTYADGVAIDMHPETNMSNPRSYFFIDDNATTSNPSIMVGLRHSDGANVMFVDGHGRHVKQDIKPHSYGATPMRIWYPEEDPGQELLWDPWLQGPRKDLIGMPTQW